MRSEKNMKTRIFDIQRGSFVDGPGIRTVVFFKGCNMRCKWCHSPESRSPEKQIMFYRDKCAGCGRCGGLTANDDDFICLNGAKEICGRDLTLDEVLSEILPDKVFYDVSDGGVTFSGGECMLQMDFLDEILKKCREHGVRTAVDTAGCVEWESFERIIPSTDLFLYDVKCITESLHIEGTGVSNRLILENLGKLSERRECEIIIRIPVVPGFNTGDDETEKLSRFVKGIRHKKVELLPYHGMGKFKYDALGEEFAGFEPPGSDLISGRLKELFE